MLKRITNNIALYTGPIAPRTVQKLRAAGYLCCIIPCPAEAPGLRLLEDIDGTKAVVLFTDKEKDYTPGEAAALFDCGMADLPVTVIAGAPDDAALTRPANGVLQGEAEMYVNAENIALGEMKTEGAVTLTLYETAGRETAFELYCEAYDFGFRTLFAPWEMKCFRVEENGLVTETFA